MPKYRILTPLKHDGKLYVVGSEIELTDKMGSLLIANKTIEAQVKPIVGLTAPKPTDVPNTQGNA